MTVTATARPAPSRALGLALRAVPGSGAEVTKIERGSAGARAGLLRGDVITRVGATAAPSPAHLARAFAALGDGQQLMLAITRGDSHHVLVLGQ